MATIIHPLTGAETSIADKNLPVFAAICAYRIADTLSKIEHYARHGMQREIAAQRSILERLLEIQASIAK